MADSRVVEALRHSIKQAGGLGPFLVAADAIECRLAEQLNVSPAEIDAATLIVADQLEAVGAMVRPVLEVAENLEGAFNRGDDERCRYLLQQLADHLLASGYKARKRKRMPSCSTPRQ